MACAFYLGIGAAQKFTLTLRALEVFSTVQVVVLVKGDGIAAETCRTFAPQASCEIVDKDVASRRVVALVKAGQSVVRVASDEPLAFGGLEAEIRAVSDAGIAFEVVAGVPAAIALAAHAGLPLVATSDASPSVAWVAVDAHHTLHSWSRLAEATDVLVVETEASFVPEIARELVFHGRSPETACALVRHVSQPNQETMVTKLGGLLHAPAGWKRCFLYVGTLAASRDRYRSFDKRPLFGKRVLVTRAEEQGASLAALLSARGAVPVLVPAIRIVPSADEAEVTQALERMTQGGYDWVVFTSANGVRRSFDHLAQRRGDARAFGRVKIAAIGPATARALADHGLCADVMAREFVGEGLAAALLESGAQGKRVLLLRAKVARDALPLALRQEGCDVDVVPVYETHGPTAVESERLVQEIKSGADAVTFTSSSTVQNVCGALGADAPAMLSSTVVASIGPVTSETLSQHGVPVHVTASVFTTEGLVEALEAHFAKRSGTFDNASPVPPSSTGGNA